MVHLVKEYVFNAMAMSLSLIHLFLVEIRFTINGRHDPTHRRGSSICCSHGNLVTEVA